MSAGPSFVGDEEAQAGWHPAGLSFQPVPVTSPEIGGSTWQSLVRGSDVETDFINGEISLIARHNGCRAPINERLTTLVRHAARPLSSPRSAAPADTQLSPPTRGHEEIHVLTERQALEWPCSLSVDFRVLREDNTLAAAKTFPGSTYTEYPNRTAASGMSTPES